MKSLALFTVLFFIGPVVADEVAAKKYLKDLEGTYTVVSMTRSGTAASAEQLAEVTAVVVKGDNLTIRFAKGGYERLLTLALRFRWIVVTAAVALFAGTLWLFGHLGAEFVPKLDEGSITAML